MSDHHLGQRFGYLEYHLGVLNEELKELDRELETIRKEYNGNEQYRKERNRLLEFRAEVKNRATKLSEQSDGMKEHMNDTITEAAEKQYESAYSAHQEKGIDKIPKNTGFKKGTEWSE